MKKKTVLLIAVICLFLPLVATAKLDEFVAPQTQKTAVNTTEVIAGILVFCTMRRAPRLSTLLSVALIAHGCHELAKDHPELKEAVVAQAKKGYKKIQNTLFKS